VLLTFIILIGLVFFAKVVAERTIARKFMEKLEDDYGTYESYRLRDNSVKAECKVISVRDSGHQRCVSCKGGIREDQREHGWWDWMQKDEKEDGWGEDGIFRKEPMDDITPEEREMMERKKRLEQEKKEMKDMDAYEGKTPEEMRKMEEEKMEKKRQEEAMMADQPMGHSMFPCHEIIIEVNPNGEKRDWEGDDDEEDNPGHRRRFPHCHKKRKHHHKSSKESSEEHDRRHPEPRHEKSDEDEPMLPEEGVKQESMADKLWNLEQQAERQMEDMLARGVHHATLYDSAYTAKAHPQCSVSICKGRYENNRRAVETFSGEYKKMLEAGETFPCYYDPEDKKKVWELEPEAPEHARQHADKRRGHHHVAVALRFGMLGLFLLGGVFFITFMIRRCLQCKRECGASRCQRAAALPAPEVVTVDTPQTELSEKEKEALGIDQPPTPKAVWVSEEGSAPPAYTDYKSALEAWTAAQDKAIEKPETEA
jgi:hypothetical protein